MQNQIQPQTNAELIAMYIANKQQCERDIQEANTQLAISNNQLETLLRQAENQFGTKDLNQLNQILIDLTNQKVIFEEELSKLNGGN